MDETALAALRQRYDKARARRAPWESLWQDCYDYGFPGRGQANGDLRRGEKLYDGTAPDAVDQLAASLLAQLTPPWSRWFGFAPGPDVPQAARGDLAAMLDRAAATMQGHFDRSSFAVEIHQCYLDLVTAGTAALLVEEAALGEASAFRFTAVPLHELVLEEGDAGRLDLTFRRSELTPAQIVARFPDATLPDDVQRRGRDEPDARIAVIESVRPNGFHYLYTAFLEAQDTATAPLAEGRFALSPFVSFRWLKAPGDVYGRSPLMKALPDIKTANKVVELVLKNASIAVTGIWQAEDDGVLNPANVRLVPGAIIAKAPGSAGLTPLQAPGRFDLSQLVLDDLRARIRHALLADRLGQVDAPQMTATEVLERGAEMTRLLGATFGRLQGELLTPLIRRGLAILQRRGEVPAFPLDGRTVVLQHLSPLARIQAQANVQTTLLWLERVGGLGPEAAQTVDAVAAARWLATTLGVPGELVREAGEPSSQ
jgi:hypothetical protein